MNHSERIHATYQGWNITFFNNGSHQADDPVQSENGEIPDISEFLPHMENPQKILKHDHRSEVGTFEIDGVTYVVKKFTIQSSWFWFQWTSLLFPTMGEKAYRNGIELMRDGFLTPVPVLLMQRTRRNMVIGSWLVYRYMEGETLTADDATEIVNFVKRMHRSGWVHRDPHPANFLRTSEGIATIDPLNIRRRDSRMIRLDRYLQAYDVVLMSHDMPSTPDIYGRDELGAWWTLAKLGHETVRGYRKIKHSLRRGLGIRGSAGASTRK